MKIGRCPTCHAYIDLVAMMEDEAGRQLLVLIGRLSPKLTRALLTYLTLFRPAKRDLSLSRTLTLAESALELTRDTDTLSAAMLETVESIRNKPGSKQMKNHNYLKRVLSALIEQHGEHPTIKRNDATHADHEKRESRGDNKAAYRQQMQSLGINVDETGRLIERVNNDADQ